MRRGGLFLKYAIPMMILSAGGLLAHSLIELYFSYQENKSALGRIQQQKAANAAIRIEQFVREIEQQLVWIAQTPWEPVGVSLDHRRLDSLRLLRHAPAVTEVSHLDPAGREQLRVSRLAMDVMGSNTDYSSDPKFMQASSQKTYFSRVYFRKESEPYMTIALRGRSDNSGVVVAEANLKFIWDVVSRMEVGTGGYAYVLDDQGHLIAHPDISLVLQKTDFSVLPQVRTARANPPDNPHTEAITGRDLKSGEVLSAHASIEPLGWKVFVDRPIKEAFAPLYDSLLRTGALLLAGLLISVIASLVLVRRMVKPIRALQAGAAKIGAGELDHRIEVNTGDELEALGADFNNMSARLQESYASLERKVDERTYELREALEQQTATSEILRVISSSPTNLEPVLDAIVENAMRLSDSMDAGILRVDGNQLRMVASRGPLWHYDELLPIRPDVASGRAVIERRVIHFPDILSESDIEFAGAKEYARRFGYRTILVAPMIRKGEAIGVINIRRPDVRPFSDKEIALMQTFADQAVIAVENVRLFQELRTRTEELSRSVEQLKALAEVGQAVNSTLDLKQVLLTIVVRAVSLSAADSGAVYEFDDAHRELQLRATHGFSPETADALLANAMPLGKGAVGAAAERRAPVEIPDLRTTKAYDGPLRVLIDALPVRAVLAVPLLQGSRVVGALSVGKNIPGSFSPEVLDLLQTFAVQSTLAIQNARLFHEIEHKSRELESASQHKSDFLANMSHELRTPLNAIIGFSEVLKDGVFGDLNDKQAEYMRDIHASGHHLLSLINDILDLSKIEAGRMELTVTAFDIPTAIDNAVMLVRERASRHQLTIDVQVDQRLNSFAGDERKFKQILLNLLSNAIKFTPEGGHVSVSAQLTDIGVQVAVQDTGIGIAAQDQAAVFEAFRQVTSNYNAKREGTGLGLALVKQFVEMHGGSISLQSTPAKGSTFTFTLATQPLQSH